MHNRHTGYTLISTLLAVSLLLTLAAYTACSFTDSHNPDYCTKHDSHELILWLGEKMAIADATGANFTLTYYTDKLRLVWTSGNRYAKDDYFHPDKCKLYSSTSGECVYSGQWHTMTPAATYTLSYKTRAKTYTQKVIISGQGYLH